jgi:hypothetical protein
LTRTAFAARDDVQAEMRSVFDRPKPFTINSLRVTPATKQTLAAELGFREFGSGTPAGRYLRPQVFGGQRPHKSFERALGLPPNRQAMPAKWAELDAYGNISPGQLRAIMSSLQLGPTEQRQGIYGGRSRGRLRRERYFIVPVGRTDTDLPPGIYRTAADGSGPPFLVIGFFRAARYKRRLDFFGVGERSVAQHFPAHFLAALAEAMATARR